MAALTLIKLAAAVVPLVCAALPAHAQLSVSAQFAKETHGGIDRVELGLMFPMRLHGQIGSASWDVMLNVDVERWRASADDGQHRYVLDVGVTPQLRLRWAARRSFEPFVDVGIGVHLLSARDIGDRHLGTRFQFGEHLGLGVVFGECREWAVSVRLMHESNGGIDRENGGLTSIGLRLEYTLQ